MPLRTTCWGYTSNMCAQSRTRSFQNPRSPRQSKRQPTWRTSGPAPVRPPVGPTRRDRQPLDQEGGVRGVSVQGLQQEPGPPKPLEIGVQQGLARPVRQEVPPRPLSPVADDRHVDRLEVRVPVVAAAEAADEAARRTRRTGGSRVRPPLGVGETALRTHPAAVPSPARPSRRPRRVTRAGRAPGPGSPRWRARGRSWPMRTGPARAPRTASSRGSRRARSSGGPRW